jgi:hypothetical protein
MRIGPLALTVTHDHGDGCRRESGHRDTRQHAPR